MYTRTSSLFSSFCSRSVPNGSETHIYETLPNDHVQTCNAFGPKRHEASVTQHVLLDNNGMFYLLDRKSPDFGFDQILFESIESYWILHTLMSNRFVWANRCVTKLEEMCERRLPAIMLYLSPSVHCVACLICVLAAGVLCEQIRKGWCGRPFPVGRTGWL